MTAPAKSAEPTTNDERKGNSDGAYVFLVLTYITAPVGVVGLLVHGFLLAALVVGVVAFLTGAAAHAAIWANSPEGIAQRAKEEAEREKRLTDLAEEAGAARKAATEYRARRERVTSGSATALGDPIIEQMKKLYAETEARQAARNEIEDQIVAKYGGEKDAWPQHVKDMLQDLDELIASGGVGPGNSPWGRG
jgi:hypothetical protein